MVNSVFFDPNVGGDGSIVTDDGDPVTGLDQGGHRYRFVPSLVNLVAVAKFVLNLAAGALNAPGTSATSTTSLTIGIGSLSFVLAQTGKAFAVGQTVVLASTVSPGNQMIGIITAFNPATGAITVNFNSLAGAGTFAAWTMALTATAGVATSRAVNTSGLATGGGNLTTDRTINVTAAAASDVQLGTDNTKALTSLALMASSAFQILTDAATIVWNTTLGYNAKVTLGGNRTLGTPTPLIDGMSYTIKVIQDATGGRTLAYTSAWDFGAALAPTLSTGANKVDMISGIYSADDGLIRASFRKGA